MHTQRLRATLESVAGQRPRDGAGDAAIETAASLLRVGGTVAFATETVYGLGANALDAVAVAKIFAAKQRPGWDPLIVHVADEAMLERVVGAIPPPARALMDCFWPGPLTLLMPRARGLPDAVTAGRETVGVRMPAHPVALALLRAAGVPVAAPSANTFGHVSPTTAAHVAADLEGRIDAILNSGETLHGVESTVVDTTTEPCLVYRPGAVTLEQIRAVWPATEMYVERAGPAAGSSLPSPGLSLRHYAPRARLVLVEDVGGAEQQAAAALLAAIEKSVAGDQRVGLMRPLGPAFDEAARRAAVVFDWGAWGDAEMLAHRLFAGLRALDEAEVEVIVCAAPGGAGLAAAIRDRLRKAARRE